MNAWLIFLGVVLLIFPVIVLLQFVAMGVYWLFASNAIDYLIWPFIVLLAAGGAWALLLGFGVL